MRSRGRVDDNHNAIVDALRDAGCTVQSLGNIGKGCPDLLVGFRQQNFVLEVKNGSLSPSRRELTDREAEWHGWWRGQVQVVESVEEALKAIGL